MLMASRKSPAWLQVSAVPLSQMLPSGSGKAGGHLHYMLPLTPASSPASPAPLCQTRARGLLASGPAHHTAGVVSALLQLTQPGLSPPLPVLPQCGGSMQDLTPAATSLVGPWQISYGCVPIPIVALGLCDCPFDGVSPLCLATYPVPWAMSLPRSGLSGCWKGLTTQLGVMMTARKGIEGIWLLLALSFLLGQKGWGSQKQPCHCC